MIDPVALHLVLGVLTGRLDRRDPARAPNANAYAERFVRWIKDECLDRLIPIGERHFQHAVAEYVEHDPRERNHQGLDNRLIVGAPGAQHQESRATPSAARRVAQRL